MIEDLQLNVPLLRRRVPNLTAAARAAGLRPATVSNLCTGKIPVGRAEVRTLVILASLAGCTLDELIIRGRGVGIIETGIKVLDLLAPVVRGGTIGLVANPGMGQLVLLTELFFRLKKREFATVFWSPPFMGPGISDIVNNSENVCESLDQVEEQVSNLRNERDVLLAADRSVVLSGELLELRQRLQQAGSRPVTLALVDCRGEAADEESPYGPLDTLWRFDIELVTRRMYPAIDPVASISTALEGAQLEAAHLAIQQRARKCLRRYRELRSLVMAWGLEKLPEVDVPVYLRGERLEAFLTQPFYIAEPFTKKAAEWVSINDTLDGVRRILDGETDEIDPKSMTAIGRFSIGDLKKTK